MSSLPDDALVIRGGLNTVELLKTGSGVTMDADGKLYGVSVNSASGKTIAELAVGIPHKRIGVTSVGAVRRAGGEVTPYPTIYNPNHCQSESIFVLTAHDLLNPPVPNPSRTI